MAALLLLLTACDTSVVNPGRIQDQDLDRPVAGNVVLVGLVRSFEDALDNVVLHTGLAADELEFSGTRSWLFFFSNGQINPIDVNETWPFVSEARWAAEQGIERLKQTQPNPDRNPLVAAAHMWAGYSLRVMGDAFCQATFDGGPAEPNAAYYQRAIGHFEQARAMAQTIGAAVDSIRLASIAGMAQSHLILKNYDQAAQLAAQVPDNFQRVAHFGESGRENNLIWAETWNQTQVTVFGTPIAALGPNGDPRTPWQDMNRLGAGGTVPFLRQGKYNNRGSDIPLAKGAEMRLIEAEVALRSGDVAGAVQHMNRARSIYRLPALEGVTTEAQAWVALDHERLATLWLEGRRLKDNQRFFEEGRNTFLQGRDKCFPFSDTEINSNPNLRG